MNDYKLGFQEASCMIGLISKDELIAMATEDTDYNRGWLDALTQTTD